MSLHGRKQNEDISQLEMIYPRFVLWNQEFGLTYVNQV